MTKLSVIIPFYNEVSSIKTAVDSAFQETSSHKFECEIIIVNDGAVSDTVIAEAIMRSIDVTIIKNRFGKGPGGARNTGIEFATGDLIAFLDADDCWVSGKLNAYLPLLQRGANFVCSGYLMGDLGPYVSPPKKIEQPIDIFKKRGIGTSTVVTTKDLISGHRFRDLRFSQDIDFWFQLAHSNLYSFSSVDAPLAVYSVGGSTRNKFVQALSFYKVLKINNVSVIQRFLIMSGYMFNGVLKHYLRF